MGLHKQFEILSKLLDGVMVTIDNVDGKTGSIKKITIEPLKERHWDDLELVISAHVLEHKNGHTYLYPISRLSRVV